MNAPRDRSTDSKYKQIASAILREYEANGNRLTKTQVEMARDFGVTRLTIRRALDWLEMEGKLARLSGRSYVRTPPELPSATRIIGFPIWSSSLVSIEVALIEHRLSLARAAHLELLNAGYWLDIQCVGPRRNPDLQKIDELCRRWDGLILEPREQEKEIGSDHPFGPLLERAAIIGTLQGRRHNCVCPDYYGAAQIAVAECARLDLRRILYTGREDEPVPHLFVRQASAEIAISRYRDMELFYAEGGLHAENTFSAVKRFFMKGGRCDAILAGSSYATLGAMRAVVDLGLRIPEEIQIIGIGGYSQISYMVPRPTVITSERHQFGSSIARMAMLLSHADAEPRPNVLVPVHLVPGETTLAPTPEPVDPAKNDDQRAVYADLSRRAE
ncbi:MAG TPA: substrate-binding domain-containing protein [Chthoniobacteraceae bacterium]|nr:substrate-binding domain-containing protein [Chthoniobacteraceae bacterium]